MFSPLNLIWFSEVLPNLDEDTSVFDYAAASFSYHSSAYLKIQDGCDNNCGYCRVHVARGKAISFGGEIV